MKSKVIKAILSVSIISIMLFTTVSKVGMAVENKPADSTTNVQIGEAEIKSKSEVVYATLSAKGAINAIYVVNHFELEKGGNITDYGIYKSVLNLTESKLITSNGDSVSLQTEAENFYYQGNMETTDLPWIFKFSYVLDGVEMEPQEIAGKTGKLGINIKVSDNEKVNATFYDNYMLQISLKLDSDKCTNITAPDATIADAGNSKMLAFTVMPKKGADYQVTTDVKDFTMSGIEISAIPFSMSVDLQNADDMVAEFNQLPKAIDELNDGVGKLADGTAKLKDGANKLKYGSTEFKNGLAELKKNSGAITEVSSQINGALAKISTSLNAGSNTDMDLSTLTQLPKGLSQLASGLQGISGGLKELKTGFATASSALDYAILNIPDTVITEEQLDAEFSKATEEQRKLLDQLYASYTAGQSVKGTYKQVKPAFDAVAPTIDTISTNIDTISGSLETISTQLGNSLSDMDIAEQLNQLTLGMSQISKNYSAFDKGLSQYMKGIGKIADGYTQFHSGISEFGDGVKKLNNGVEELYNGTGKLNDEVAKMPMKIQDKIDKLTSEYDSPDFVPTSFVSSKNENTELVQFVLKGKGIELPKVPKPSEITEVTNKKETVWDRIVALFQ